MANLRGLQLLLFSTAKGQQGGPLSLLADLTPFAVGVTYDKVAQGGYGTLQFTLSISLDWMTWLYDQGPALHVEIRDASLISCYEGMLFTTEQAIGDSRLSRSLAQMFNRVIMTYGKAGVYGTQRDTISTQRFGAKETHVTGGIDADKTSAIGYTTSFQAEHRYPTSEVNPVVGTRGAVMSMPMSAQGYWNTLSWCGYGGASSAKDTGLQMRNVMNDYSLGGVFQHGYISSDMTGIPNTGVSVTQGALISQNGQERMLWLMNIGTVNKLRIMGGLGPGRKFRWFERDAATPAYYFDLWESTFHDSGGALIPKHYIEPGHFIKVRPHFPIQNNYNYDSSVAYDCAADPYCVFVDRCVYTVDNDVLRPSPTDAITMEQFLVRTILKRGAHL